MIRNIKMFITVILLLFTGTLSAQTIITDYGTSGIADNGTLEGTVSLDPDARYGSSSLRVPPGDGNRLQLTQPVTDLDQAGSYTYMAWIKRLSGTEKGIIGLGNCCSGGSFGVNSNREGYTMNITGSSQIRYWAGSTSNDNNHNLYTPDNIITTGIWHHVAIRVQPGQVQILVDGVVQATGSESNIPTSPSLAAANDYSTNVPKVGGDGISEGSDAEVLIDEVRVYSSFLNDADIADVMNNTGPLPDRLWYTFEPASPGAGGGSRPPDPNPTCNIAPGLPCT